MRFFYLFTLLITLQSVFGFDVNHYAKSNVTNINTFNRIAIHADQLLIEMPFAKAIILNKEQKKQLQERVVIKVALVYTHYRASATFNQIELNKKRLLELKKLVPELFAFPVWKYELIGQTDGNSTEECNKMFHGFVITFRPLSTDIYAAQESNYVKQLVSNLSTIDSLAKDTTPKPFHIKTRWDNGYVYDTIWGEEKKIDFYPSPPPNPYLASLQEDSTVLNAFSRNKNWTNFIVVTDATGSMSPYYSQVLTWLRGQFNNENARLFVFFNDGNRKPSDKKLPLETGGIYVTTERSYEMVSQTINKCISGGAGGGETKENDVEAMLLGLKHYPEAKNIVLIADNYERMRDYEFMNKINIPVHIFLCGADRFVNLQYLDLARVTKGSIHLTNEDVFELDKLKEGETILINEREYVLTNGKFNFYHAKKEVL
ncbi:MAG: hypothetical protein COW67_12255 [Flavobacteriales bacterium CG18_big_fil_WC_8_21_14_2_50_32_9]|nr:MAG: hypothetical protein COW67_12255 [Flavobacteriales bacterium CG18_big_fil_WC_8_21_14_2_50_32_9]